VTSTFYFLVNIILILHRHNDREVRDINSQTPIMRAIACGHESVVKAMLTFGYQINNNVKEHKTLLEWSIENEYSVLIKVCV